MYSSTTLDGPSKSGCWRQVDFAEKNVPSLFPLEYRSYLGQAAHAVMQYCAERKTESEADIRKTAEEVGNLLISKGRVFRGREEPPLPAEDVWAGVDIAVAYLLACGLPLDAEILIPERDFKHPTIPCRALIDLVTAQDESGEEYELRVVELTDYKSSFQAGEMELHTLQRWMQTVIMWRLTQSSNEDIEGEFDVIRQRVVNLRTWQEYARDIDLRNEDDIALLETWERRINSLCMTAHHNKSPVDGRRPAAPGIGCVSCAWRHVCEEVYPAENPQALSIDEIASELAITEGQRSMLIKLIKKADPESPVPIEGGWVGFKEQARRKFDAGFLPGLLETWLTACACELPEEDISVMVSLLAALNLGKSNLDALAKTLMPERTKGIVQARADYVESLTNEVKIPVFGVWKNEEQKE